MVQKVGFSLLLNHFLLPGKPGNMQRKYFFGN